MIFFMLGAVTRRAPAFANVTRSEGNDLVKHADNHRRKAAEKQENAAQQEANPSIRLAPVRASPATRLHWPSTACHGDAPALLVGVEVGALAAALQSQRDHGKACNDSHHGQTEKGET